MTLKEVNIESSSSLVMRARLIHVSPRKLNLVVKLLRKVLVYEALNRLSFCRKRASRIVYNFLVSILSDAENNHGLNPDSLFILSASVGKDKSMKRFRAGSRGRSTRIVRRLSNMHVVLYQKGGF